MNPENFAEWMRRHGRKVYRTESSYWCEAAPHVLQAFPYHWVISPSDQELDQLMRKHGIWALRYSTPIEAQTGKVSYHIILNAPYTLESLRSKYRRGVVQGLSQFTIEQIPFSRMEADGWRLQEDTIHRQKRTDCIGHSEWIKMCQAAAQIPGFEAWGATLNRELGAALFTARIDDHWYVLYAMSHRKFFDKYINNAIFYAVSQELLKRDGIRTIFFTVQSLDACKSVDEFKFRMSFKPKLVRQRVSFHPYLRPIITRTTHQLLQRLLRITPGNYFVAKAEGMVRFFLEGQLPVKQQDLPEVAVPFDESFPCS